jgi:tetratricopeptide (TPR) repeat protein
MFLQRQSIGSPSRKSGVFVLAVLLAILPATLHNAVASRDFVLINYDDGFNLYLGNSPWATGISYSFPPFISADTRPEEITETLVARQASGGNELSPSAVSAYWRNQALTYIFENPVHIVKMWRTKFLAFWNVEQQFDNYDIPFIQQNFPTVLSLPLVTLRLISPLAFLAAVGLWRTRHEKIVPFVLLGTIYMGSVLLFYVTDRYRLPMLIFLLPLAGAVVPTIVTLAQSKRWRSLGAALVAAIVMTILSLWPQATPNFTAYDWGTLSSLESDSGHYEESISMIDKGLAVSPSEVGAEGMIKAAYAYEKLGLADQAEALLQQARILYPGDGSVLYNIGRLQALAGHLSDALESFQKAMSLSPNFILSYLGVASIEQHLGHADKAREALARGLVIDPQNIQLRALEQQL